ncbi:MAG: hydroxyethylthiazole kinase [Micrococcaceae bacterium]
METLTTLRERAPLVQCLTNSVVQQITADALLAVGAAPAMVDHPVEAAEFARVADGVLVNIGTLSDTMAEAMRAAVGAATETGTPWVLDPVAVGGLSVRTRLAHELVESGPSAIRGNASEVAALAGRGSGGRGVDSTDDVDAVLDSARELARRTGAVVAVSGPTDAIVSPGRVSLVTGGDPLMQKVIGTGCSLGAVTSAALGAARPGGGDPHDAVLAAHALLSAAGTLAARTTTRPGSFGVAWLDALDELTPDQVARLVTVEERS